MMISPCCLAHGIKIEHYHIHARALTHTQYCLE
jgi:hypothetical protein